MLLTKFLEGRRSTRKFKKEVVDKDILDQLMYYGKKIEEEYGEDRVEFKLFEEGNKVYSSLKGLGGYAGVMIESPHYIGLQIDDRDKETVMRAAYSMEELSTKAEELKLGTCWVNLMEVSEQVKTELLEDKNKKIDYLLAIGYPKEQSKIFKSTSSRLSIKDIVFYQEWGNVIDMDLLEQRGLNDLFYYVRYAPSNKNNQPWRFILKNDKVVLAVVNPDNVENFTDMGIVMYYFTEMAKAIGVNNRWNILDCNKEAAGDIEYCIVGEYNI
ncbi:nitroreductase family protein [Clostridiisalibacter paucivorans]|uniref:nitroreductase family protein n=1 Tax=Clostridiisalibacter paucivorans TaxID=408753 RepID=UPI00047A4B67|nr:nitroreductase family protein [Clostridiisalibacter paucivorans]